MPLRSAASRSCIPWCVHRSLQCRQWIAPTPAAMHSMRDHAMRYCSAASKRYTDSSSRSQRFADATPIVSSTSSIGGFSPRPQGLGLFSWPAAAAATHDRAAPRRGMMRCRIRWPPETDPHAARPKPPGASEPGRLPAEDPHRARLRRRDRVGARARARRCRARLGNQVLLKREDSQPVFSFKLRGAYNKMAHLTPEQLAARRDLRLGRQPRAGRRAGGAPARLPARVIVMPVTTPQLKVDAVRGARRRGRAASATATPTPTRTRSSCEKPSRA